MEPLEIVAQIFGVIGIVLGFFIYLSKSRSRIILCKFISDVIWFFNYFFLGAYTGALLNLIAMGRETVFYNREKRKWASHRIWLYVFLLLTLISPILEWVENGAFSWIPLCPAIGSMFAVVSFYSKKPRQMRYMGYCAQILWLAYGIGIGNVTATISSALILLSAVVGNIREARARKKPDSGTDERG